MTRVFCRGTKISERLATYRVVFPVNSFQGFGFRKQKGSPPIFAVFDFQKMFLEFILSTNK